MTLNSVSNAEEPTQRDHKCPDSLEKIFQQVEAETERRCAQEDDLSAMADSMKRSKSRRRASVSISRFGHNLSEDLSSSKSTLSPPQTPNLLSTIAAKTSLYQSPMHNRSRESVASDGFHPHESSDAAHEEDVNQIVQVHEIAPRHTLGRTVGDFLSRKTRSRSGSVLSTKDGTVGNMVIGVSVVEATVNQPPVPEEEQELQRPESRMVISPGPSQLKHRSSRLSILGTSSLLSKARGLGEKLRHRSRASLKHNNGQGSTQHTVSSSTIDP